VTADHNDIYSIVERLRILEEGLDKNQRSVNQLGATFRPKTVAVLTAKTDPKNPLAGKLVGGSESAEDDRPVLEADMAEDVLEKVKSSFKDFIKQAEQSIDREVQEKKHEDTDLKKKDKTDRDLMAKKTKTIDENPSELDPDPTVAHSPGTNPIMPESSPVKTVTLDETALFEIHGNERDGFEIRRGQRHLPTRFDTLDEAELALEMFRHRMTKQRESQDYIDEA